MKRSSLLTALAVFLVALVLSACASGGGSTSTTGEPGMAVETISEGIVKVTLNATSESTEVNVTIAEGESIVITSNFDSGEAEIVTTMAEGDMTDSCYEGYGISETEIAPGTVTCSITPTDATGTIFIVSYPTGQLDFMNNDTEALYNQVVEYVGA